MAESLDSTEVVSEARIASCSRRVEVGESGGVEGLSVTGAVGGLVSVRCVSCSSAWLS
jgi:hypothetical protein